MIYISNKHNMYSLYLTNLSFWLQGGMNSLSTITGVNGNSNDNM